MKAYLRESKDNMVIIEIEGQNLAERVLLSHLADQHSAIACVGSYGGGRGEGKGMRFLVMNRIEEPERRRRR